MVKWTQKEIDQAYNFNSFFGGLIGVSWDYVSGSSRSKGFIGTVIHFFAGVGLGGTATYGYLYSQGVYDDLYK